MPTGIFTGRTQSLHPFPSNFLHKLKGFIVLLCTWLCPKPKITVWQVFYTRRPNQNNPFPSAVSMVSEVTRCTHMEIWLILFFVIKQGLRWNWKPSFTIYAVLAQIDNNTRLTTFHFNCPSLIFSSSFLFSISVCFCSSKSPSSDLSVSSISSLHSLPSSLFGFHPLHVSSILTCIHSASVCSTKRFVLC